MGVGEEEVKAEIQLKDKRDLVDVKYGDQRSEKELERGTILFRNESNVGVRIDKEGFSDLLRREGLSAEQTNSVEVVFRSATYADRSFYGRIIGGLHPFGLDPIEAYTTLVTDNNRVHETHIPVRERRVASNLLHELGHRLWRLLGGAPSNSFYAPTPEAGETTPSEQFAIQFAKDHLVEFKDGLETYPLSFLPFQDNTGADRRVGELEKYGDYVDLDKRVVVSNPDNPVLYLEEEVDRRIFSVEDLRDFEEDELVKLLGRASALTTARKFGLHEYQWLMMRLKVAFAERGTREMAGLIEEWKIKPPS